MAQTEGQGGRGTQEAEGQAGQEEGNQVNWLTKPFIWGLFRISLK